MIIGNLFKFVSNHSKNEFDDLLKTTNKIFNREELNEIYIYILNNFESDMEKKIISKLINNIIDNIEDSNVDIIKNIKIITN